MLNTINKFMSNENDSLLRIIGIPKDIDQYFDTINAIISNKNTVFVFENIIKQDINLINNIKNAIPEYKLEDLLNGNLVENLDNIGFFNFIKNDINKSNVKQATAKMLQSFYSMKLSKDKNTDNVKITTSKNFLAGVFAFIKEYIKDKDYNKLIALFLGEFKKNDEFIIIFMQQLNFKVVYFNGEHDLFYLKDGTLLNLPKSSFLNNYIKEDKNPISNLVIEAIDTMKELQNSFESKTDIYKEGNKTIIPHYFQMVFGVRNDDDETVFKHVNNILSAKDELKSNTYFTFVDFNTKMNILDTNKTYLNKIEELLGKDLDTDNLISNLDKCGIFLNDEVTSYFKKTLKIFVNLSLEYYKNKNISNVCDYINTIFAFIRKNTTRLNNLTKEKQVYLCYGDINDVSISFLYFLSIIGFNVFYFSLDKKSMEDVKIMECLGDISFKTENNKSVKNINFPNERLISRRTVAYVASEEINEMMSSEQMALFKPYQLNDKNIVNSTLILTYDEINILLKEKSIIRPNFSYDEKDIFIPNIFAKVNGTDEDINKYLENIEKNKSLPNSDFVCTIKSVTSLTALKIGTNSITNDILDRGGKVNFEKLIEKNFYKYNHIRITSQHLFVNKISELITSKNIFLFDMTYDNVMLILNVVLNIETPNIGEILHTFDYVCDIPKIILFINIPLNNNDAKNLSIFLAFINILGFDIVMYSPTGYIDIEKYLKDSIFSQHTLNNMNNTIEYKKQAKRGKGFFRFGL